MSQRTSVSRMARSATRPPTPNADDLLTMKRQAVIAELGVSASRCMDLYGAADARFVDEQPPNAKEMRRRCKIFYEDDELLIGAIPEDETLVCSGFVFVWVAAGMWSLSRYPVTIGGLVDGLFVDAAGMIANEWLPTSVAKMATAQS